MGPKNAPENCAIFCRRAQCPADISLVFRINQFAIQIDRINAHLIHLRNVYLVRIIFQNDEIGIFSDLNGSD